MRCDEVACPQRCWNGLCVFGDKVLQSCGMVDPGVEPKGRGVQGPGPLILVEHHRECPNYPANCLD
jgi:hypothetical protein